MERRKRSSIRAAGEPRIRAVGEPYISGILARTTSRDSSTDKAIPTQIIGDGIVPLLSSRGNGHRWVSTAVDPARVVLRQCQRAHAQLSQMRKEIGRASCRERGVD